MPRIALADDDVGRTISIHQSDDVSVAIGGLLQLQLAPYVGDAAQVDNDDVATRAGFRMRRARIGFDATFKTNMEFVLVISPLTSDPEVGTISQAELSYAHSAALGLSIGANKVPFTHAELTSSSALASIERPLTARTLVPQRRLGAQVGGAVLNDSFAYAVGVMNATEGYELGNRYSGMLYVGRATYSIADSKLVIGTGGFYEDGVSTTTVAGSANLTLALSGAALTLEGLCDQKTPKDAPEVSPSISDKITRCGAYAEATYDIAGLDIQPAVRAELFDDNRNIKDAGDALLVSAGVNATLTNQMRAQLHYLGRFERKSSERANDSVVLGVQGAF